MLTSIEMCAGAGGQALGLEQAGFGHEALIEIENNYCKTLEFNRPKWNVLRSSLADFDGRPYKGIDLVNIPRQSRGL
jgi:DNA (cytosine-5)-methyltransferase 1